MNELKLKICMECMKDVAEVLADMSMTNVTKEDLAKLRGQDIQEILNKYFTYDHYR
mgnify:CR=1 FL=1